MALIGASAGWAADSGEESGRKHEGERVVALAGNPDVGKGMLFGRLTGFRRLFGRWAGKTASCARGRCSHAGRGYLLVDLPDSNSLLAHSAEEETARDFVCFGGADAVLVVCGAASLDQNLSLVLQIIEITPKVVVCVNFMKKARRRHVRVDLNLLSERLGVPVVAADVGSGRGTSEVLAAAEAVIGGNWKNVENSAANTGNQLKIEENVCGKDAESGEKALKPADKPRIEYAAEIEEAIAFVLPHAVKLAGERIDARWLAVRLIEHDLAFYEAIEWRLGVCIGGDEELEGALQAARERLRERGMNEMRVRDELVRTLVRHAERICRGAVIRTDEQRGAANGRPRRLTKGRFM